MDLSGATQLLNNMLEMAVSPFADLREIKQELAEGEEQNLQADIVEDSKRRLDTEQRGEEVHVQQEQGWMVHARNMFVGFSLVFGLASVLESF